MESKPKVEWFKRLFGVGLLCAATAIALPAQTFTKLHGFDGTDGDFPRGPLVQATNGNFYGTTYEGGEYNWGTVFKITLSGKLTTLYSFCSQGQPCTTDGYFPSPLVPAGNENFYGTTWGYGGAYGWGTVFKITPSGTLTTIYSFCPQGPPCTDGYQPWALIQATDGNLYGTTWSGGSYSSGTIFKITPSGTLTTLYAFCSQSGCPDSSGPYGPLIQATDGNLYGVTTGMGGNGSFGTIFKITLSGTLTTLYYFGLNDGSSPTGLVQAPDGNFYGTTSAGGANGECCGDGTVFEITPSGTLTTLYNFCSQSGCTDGENPFFAPVVGTDGNIYGTTNGGGANKYGTVFEITGPGALTTLYSFCSQKNCRDGGHPGGGPVQDTNGTFYGVAEGGGGEGAGSVYSLSVGLGPFMETQPTSGKVGKAVKILGTNLTGATSVTFNGTAATFTVVSSSLITTTVPSGATTGTVQVVTPSGTLSSNVPFRVP